MANFTQSFFADYSCCHWDILKTRISFIDNKFFDTYTSLCEIMILFYLIFTAHANAWDNIWEGGGVGSSFLNTVSIIFFMCEGKTFWKCFLHKGFWKIQLDLVSLRERLSKSSVYRYNNIVSKRLRIKKAKGHSTF